MEGGKNLLRNFVELVLDKFIDDFALLASFISLFFYLGEGNLGIAFDIFFAFGWLKGLLLNDGVLKSMKKILLLFVFFMFKFSGALVAFYFFMRVVILFMVF